MNSERTAQLQVALASYDLKELRVQKRYLQEQGTAIDCTCFCSGEKLLAQLRQGVRYDAVVLCSELTDLPAEQFVRQFYQLKERPMLLIQSHGRSSGTALQKLREGCYCVEGTELKRLLWKAASAGWWISWRKSRLLRGWRLRPIQGWAAANPPPAS